MSRGTMNDLQAKFAVSVVALGLLFSYVFPAAKQAKSDHDSVSQQVGQVYVAPNAGDPSAPSGYVTIDELQKYAAKKAAERKAMGLP